MSKKRQLNIPIIPVFIVILLIVVAVIVFKISSKNNDSQDQSVDNSVGYRYVKILENDLKINTSTKLSETKTFGNLSFSDLQLFESDEISTLTGTITNNSTEVQPSSYFNCYMINESNEIQYTLAVFLKQDLAPNESTTFSAGITLDNVDIYDLYIGEYTEAQ